MKLFFRALLLGILGLGSIGGALLYAPQLFGIEGSVFSAVSVFLFLFALLFGVAALYQAKDDYREFKKANKKTPPAHLAVLILLTLIVLAYAGFQFWHANQPVDVQIAFTDAKGVKPLPHAPLYLSDSSSPAPNVGLLSVVTDENGIAHVWLARGKSWNVYATPPKAQYDPSISQINLWDFSGDQLDLNVYNVSSWPKPEFNYRVQVFDEFGTAISGAKLIRYQDGTADQEFSTDEKGFAFFSLDDSTVNFLDVLVKKEGYQAQAAHVVSGSDTNLVVLKSADFVPLDVAQENASTSR